jgi:hypothetical protein
MRIFGLGGQDQQQGAVPTPEGQAAQEAGIQRFAQHEGAATKDEVKAIDFATGVDQIHTDEGTKNLIRLDRTVQWYLQRGDKDKAEAVAASLLLYGAQAVSRAGVMAQTAFQNYQKTGDPQDLRNASLAVQRAHQIIPDGLNMKIDVDPKTRQIVATTIDSEGKEQKHIVDPQQVPGLLKTAMDGSAYWEALYEVGQPQLAESNARGRRGAADKAADRAYNEEWEQRKWERNQDADREKEGRADERKMWERRLDDDMGRSEAERKRNNDNAFFTDWGDRLTAAEAEGPEAQQKVLAEGLGYRYQNTKNRQDPLADTDIGIAADTHTEIQDADKPFMLNLARVLGTKNDALDEAGAAAAAAALITGPVTNNPDGTFYTQVGDLVFNPMLLPQLRQVREKYKTAAQ